MRPGSILPVAALLTAVGAMSVRAQTAGSAASYSLRLDVGGRHRSYLVDLPPQYNARRPTPVVVVFHGGGGSASGARQQTGMTTLGRAAGFIAVYPDGSGLLGERLLTWNNEVCCGYARNQHIDEIAFVRAMLDSLEARFVVDKNRVYATGISNGGMMSYLVACALSDRFAAIAPVSGEMTTSDCHPTRPVSVLIIHGTDDQNLPWNGGVGKKAIDPHVAKPVSYSVSWWRDVDGCPTTPRVDSTTTIIHTTFSPCANSSAVELYAIVGGGHSWPRGQRMARFLDPPSDALDASRTIWDFFVKHPR